MQLKLRVLFPTLTFRMSVIFTCILTCLLFATASHAQILQRGNSTTATTTSTSLKINKPVGVIEGDVMIVNIAQTPNQMGAVTSAGWTQIDGANLGANAGRGVILYKVATAVEPLDYTFTLNGPLTSAVGSIVAFSGVDVSGTSPFDVVPSSINTSNSTVATALPLSTNSANAAVIMLGQASFNATWSGWNASSFVLNELYDNQSTTASVGAAWALKATAGSIGGNATALLSGPTRNGGILLVLKPACSNGDLGTPSFTVGAATVCQDAANTTYTATATNSTGITYSITPATAGTINAATGEVNWDATFSGTATISASAAGCNGPKTVSMEVMVRPTLSAQIAAVAATVCEGSGTNITFTGTAGTVVTYKVGAGANTTITIGSGGTATLPTGNLSTTTTYTLVSVAYADAPVCSQVPAATATVTVSTQAKPNAGTNGTLTVCAGTTPTNAQLFEALNGTPDAGGAWTNSGNVYTYTVSATAPCTEAATATVTVTINNPSIAPSSISGTTSICEGGSTTLTPVGSTLGTGAQYKWYTNAEMTTAAIGTLNQATGALTVNPNSYTTYYVRIENTSAPCQATTIAASTSVIVYPAAPVLTAPVNTCAAAFTLPSVNAVTGFTVQYQINSGAWATAANTTVPSTPGQYSIKARYVWSADNATAPAACIESAAVTTIVYPAAPVLTAPVNTCAAAFTLPSVNAVTGFTVQYQINSGAWATAANTTVPSTPGCYSVKARYVFSANGSIAPNACLESVAVNTVIFPAKPAAPTVNSGTGPITEVSAPEVVEGFNVQYSFNDGSTWVNDLSIIPTADNCNGYKIKVRYVTASACGNIAVGSSLGCSTSDATTRVVDNTAPAFTSFPSNKSVDTDAGQCFATVTLGTPVTSDACGIKSMTNNAPATYPLGTTTVTWTLTDVNDNVITRTQTVTVNNVTTQTTVTVTPVAPYPAQTALPYATQKYSDKVTFTAQVTPVCTDAGSIVNGGSIVTFKIGSQTMGTALVDANGIATLSEVALTETIQDELKAGLKDVTAVFSGYNKYLTSTGETKLQIVKEDLCATYNGFMQVAATSTGRNSCKASFALSVGVSDLDGYGDVRKLEVKFTINGTTTYTVPVQSLNSTNTEGNATKLIDFSFNGTYSTIDIKYDIISDYYQMGGTSPCDADGDVTVNLYLPQNEFITGGGFVRSEKSAGLLPAEATRKANFGFNVKYTKSGTNLQGNINYIFRRLEDDGVVHVYQVKGNAMTTLSVDANATPRVAVFNGKCNVADITENPNPLVPLKDYLTQLGGTGNSTMQVLVSDGGEPGTQVDAYAITVWNSKEQLFHSSNWISTQSVKQVLSGGNIQVSGTTSLAATQQVVTQARQAEVIEPISKAFNLKAFPNPSISSFNVQVESDNAKDKINVRVLDLYGRTVEVINSVAPGQTIKIGAVYRPGIYFVEMIQGTNRKQIKLLKQSD
jgi:hypothetical protein